MNIPGCGGQMEVGEMDEQMQAQELRQRHHFLEEEQRGRKGPRGAGTRWFHGMGHGEKVRFYSTLYGSHWKMLSKDVM